MYELNCLCVEGYQHKISEYIIGDMHHPHTHTHTHTKNIHQTLLAKNTRLLVGWCYKKLFQPDMRKICYVVVCLCVCVCVYIVYIMGEMLITSLYNTDHLCIHPHWTRYIQAVGYASACTSTYAGILFPQNK